MPLYQFPEWLDPEQASVFDSPVMQGLRAVGGFLGADDPETSIMGMGPSPLMARVPKHLIQHADPAIAAKLKSLAQALPQEGSEKFMKEVRKWGGIYERTKKMGRTDLSNEAGRRIAELDRLGRTGHPYTPTGPTVTSQSPLAPPKTIMNARVKDAIEALKVNAPYPKGKR